MVTCYTNICQMREKCFGNLEILNNKHGSRLYDMVTPKNIIKESILRNLRGFEPFISNKMCSSQYMNLSILKFY